jgi:4-hydroxybenzoate polyprenyltransferase
MNGSKTLPSIRTLLLLGRVSNLPTVWSNCLAGWLISGGGSLSRLLLLRLLLLCFGTSLLYVGGMFLNDAFDAEFDRQHRPERPVPSGLITIQGVWAWGIVWLSAGVIILSLLGQATAVLALLLALCIVLYDAIHKLFILAPILMALCRFLLILIASAAAPEDITGLTVWTGLVLALYIIGLSYLARKESAPGALQYWPCLLLAAPILLALVVNQGGNESRAIKLSIILLLWILYSLRFTYWSGQINVGRSVSNLLAGIVLVDLLATGATSGWHVVIFASLFLLALVFQRFIPAT